MRQYTNDMRFWRGKEGGLTNWALSINARLHGKFYYSEKCDYISNACIAIRQRVFSSRKVILR